jgi:hypothetical protein
LVVKKLFGKTPDTKQVESSFFPFIAACTEMRSDRKMNAMVKPTNNVLGVEMG